MHQRALSTEPSSGRMDLGDMLSQFLAGGRIQRSSVEQAANELLGRLMGDHARDPQVQQILGDLLDRADPQVQQIISELMDRTRQLDPGAVAERLRDVVSRASSRVRSRGTPPDPQAEARRAEAKAQRERAREEQRARDHQARERAKGVSRARRILGYTAKEPIAMDDLKARHRELARRHHPDRGGDVAKMQDINWAVDILSKPG